MSTPSVPTAPDDPPATTLPAPCPTHPVAGQSVEETSPGFDWTPVPGAERYRVQVASTDAFDAVHHDAVMERGASWALASQLPAGTTSVYWRVRAEAEAEAPSAWSDPAHFSVAADEASADAPPSVRVKASPVPLHPTREDLPLRPAAASFTWEGIPAASGYELQVARTQAFESPLLAVTVDRVTALTLYEALPEERGSLYWRVRPLFRATAPGPWSEARQFGVVPEGQDEAPAAPAEDLRATAQAAGPVQQARTSGALSIAVGLFALLSFLAIIALIYSIG